MSFTVEIDNHIGWLILNRPEKRNAMGVDFFKGLIENFTSLDEEPEVRVIVVRAEGKSFTVGLDLMEIGGILGDGKSVKAREDLYKNILQLQESMNVIERCRKPVIAAVHSHCIGGGVDMLSACDIRIATKDAVFSIRETKIAIIADLGTLQRLPHIIGHGRTRELALTGRDFSAEEALEMGFITKICGNPDELNESARELALEIAASSPLAVQGTKDVILYARDHGVYPGLKYVAQKNAYALLSEDLMEALGAFAEKRTPVFKGK